MAKTWGSPCPGKGDSGESSISAPSSRAGSLTDPRLSPNSLTSSSRCAKSTRPFPCSACVCTSIASASVSRWAVTSASRSRVLSLRRWDTRPMRPPSGAAAGPAGSFGAFRGGAAAAGFRLGPAGLGAGAGCLAGCLAGCGAGRLGLGAALGAAPRGEALPHSESTSLPLALLSASQTSSPRGFSAPLCLHIALSGDFPSDSEGKEGGGAG
mmetsp:Transcript_72303/g.212196  ORF Transcript_72303/g.212196 Transcript_72303/m.212196 type:complete len:211 (+) Transcript_72303:169-801(+)